MRSEFHDVFKDAYDYWIDDACIHRYHASKSLALQVWNHRQTEVDELEQSYVLLETDYLKECKEKDELQKRVDSALKNIDQFYCEGNLDSLEKAEQALKGET